MVAYAELHCKTNYSFLQGASHADELVARAQELGYTALAITDENSLAGVVRAFAAARATPLKLIIGAELTFADAPSLVAWAPDRAAYGRLSRLITLGRRRAPKGECWLKFSDLQDLHHGLLFGVIDPANPLRTDSPANDPQHPSHEWFAGQVQVSPHDIRDLLGDRVYWLAELYFGIDDRQRLAEQQAAAAKYHMPLVASGDVLYHVPQRQSLHDLLTAIRYRSTVDAVQQRLQPNAQRHLQTRAVRQQQFAGVPDALARSVEIADRCEFRLDQLRYEYPHELAPAGKTPIEFLGELTRQGLQRRYPQGAPEKVLRLIEHELRLIQEMRYEAYFLTVWDLVRFARSRGILCQGRGSAANSAVCYCLGVTSVDPATTELLFERFISKERNEAPDIDVDFEHERREEVLQYLYEKYGRDRAGLAATVITYRSRSAVRDVGKALGLSLDRVDALAKQIDGYHNCDDLPVRCAAVGIDPQSAIGTELCARVDELLGFPRHLSQHVGGMVMTEGNLEELVPIENAAMDGRTVIQWDKDDLEELGLLKVDCLCLGMLTAIRKCFDMIAAEGGPALTLANIPPDDCAVYDMICDADTVGVFQIESRGQMSMLPRLKPRCWYDLVIEVAIVRPGPIQGNMVHPYLRRRSGQEQITYPNDEIRAVLHRTLGVPIFQEQAMKLAIVAAGFTPGEADQLRRAMGAWRKTGVIEKFRQKLMEGMRAKGLSDEFAEQVFRQIRGFGEYGFPESHAASFALLVYVSAWLKCYYPAAFTAAILNSQPMGFYSSAQLVADAKRHGVSVLPPDVNHSDWDSTLERLSPTDSDMPGQVQNHWALRLGLREIVGLSQDAAIAIKRSLTEVGPYFSVFEFATRTELGAHVISRLSDADAFASLKQDRREALWQALGQERKAVHQPLFAELTGVDDDVVELLPELDEQQQVFADYRTIGLSLRAHPISFHRDSLDHLKVTCAQGLADKVDNRQVRVAGLVILRQRPSTAKGITFVTLEDETGTANLVVKPDIWEQYRQICRTSTAWIAHGKLEKRSGVIHVVVNRLDDLSQELQTLRLKPRDFR